MAGMPVTNLWSHLAPEEGQGERKGGKKERKERGKARERTKKEEKERVGEGREKKR